MPRWTKYAAPTYLTTPKATADVAKMADSPSAAAKACASVPTFSPTAVIAPAALPSPRVCVSTSACAGPGAIMIATLATRNVISVVESNIAPLSGFQFHRGLGVGKNLLHTRLLGHAVGVHRL